MGGEDSAQRLGNPAFLDEIISPDFAESLTTPI
jgi:hypothetical protein